ncbi:hypothetical protein ACGF07_26165 [Kitasatospora sp. NPDC048194]|uniref:hypothetical protein n=1 Tax=Kitasatospora sp. NPDC048194 TaxID=3364045 RepID=UPI00371C0E2B
MRYTITQVYVVPARSQAEATDELMLAMEQGNAGLFLVRTSVRGEKVSVLPRLSWWALIRRQLTGR